MFVRSPRRGATPEKYRVFPALMVWVKAKVVKTSSAKPPTSGLLRSIAAGVASWAAAGARARAVRAAATPPVPRPTATRRDRAAVVSSAFLSSMGAPPPMRDNAQSPGKLERLSRVRHSLLPPPRRPAGRWDSLLLRSTHLITHLVSVNHGFCNTL